MSIPGLNVQPHNPAAPSTGGFWGGLKKVFKNSDFQVGALGAASGIATNYASAAQAQKQMDFQKMMSDTAHQRQVKDLMAAGLNPILAAGGKGASSPSGAMAQMKDPTASAASAYMLKQNMYNMRMQAENLDANTALAHTKTNLVATQETSAKAAAKLSQIDVDIMEQPAYKYMRMLHLYGATTESITKQIAELLRLNTQKFPKTKPSLPGGRK